MPYKQVEHQCRRCSKTFMGMPNQGYCENECRLADKRRAERACQRCKKMFVPRTNQQWCSYSCCAYDRERPPIPVETRFWKNVDKNGPVHPLHGQCWVWTASTNEGYGQIWYPKLGRAIKASRVSWEIHFGELPQLSVLHKCDNPLCVRPSHLFLGTQADNLKDCRSKGRHAYGVKHGIAKLDDAKVRIIRNSKLSRRELADKFGVSYEVICTVIWRKTWRHVN